MKQRGFTLIELLSVIVILAIIALIATPIVLDIINESKEKAYGNSVESIMHAAKIYNTKSQFKNSLVMDQNIYSEVMEMVDGEKPKSGNLYINADGEIAFAFQYGELCYSKSYEDDTYTKEKTNVCNVPFYYLKSVSVQTNGDNQPFLENTYGISKAKIEEIITVNSNKVSDDAIYSWEVTDQENVKEEYKVIAWCLDVDKDGLYEVYIGQNGGVKANPNSSKLFAYLTNVTKIDLKNFDTSNVTTMMGMFNYCKNLQILDLSNFNTSKVTTMAGMFQQCKSLKELNLSSFNTSKVENMEGMFSGCEILTNLDLSNFNTSNVIKMSGMFQNCYNLKELNLNKWNTSKATTMSHMFNNCKALIELDLSTFDTSKVEYISYMFNNCQSLKQINLKQATFESIKENEYNKVFNGATTLNKIIVEDDEAITWLQARINDNGLTALVSKT